MLTAPGSSFTSSLYRDLREGKPVEVETILGDLVAEGRKAGVRTPLLDAATVALRVHNAAVGRLGTGPTYRTSVGAVDAANSARSSASFSW